MSKKLQIIITAYFILITCSCSILAKPTQIDFLLPANYTGSVIILYNQPDEIVPEKAEDGSVIYRIPADGFLKVKPAFERKAYKFGYYYVDGQDRRTPIEYLFPTYYVRDPGDTTSKSFDSITEDEKNNRVFVINHRTTNFDANGNRIYLYDFIVGKPKDANTILNQIETKTFEIQRGISTTVTQP